MTEAAVPPWAVVTVPFRYVERNSRKLRPALNISTEAFQRATGLCWVLMITSAEHAPWPGDVAVDALEFTGLARPSVVRTAKIALAEVDRLSPVGLVTPEVRGRVRAQVLAGLAADRSDRRG
jgi:mRNA interferase MazF